MEKIHHIRERAEVNRDIFPIILEKNALKLYFVFSEKREPSWSRNLLFNICKFLSITSTFLEVSIISSELAQTENPRKLNRLEKSSKRLAHLIFATASLIPKNSIFTNVFSVLCIAILASSLMTMFILKLSGVFSIITGTIFWIIGTLTAVTLSIARELSSEAEGSYLNDMNRSLSTEPWEMKWFSRPLAYLLPRDDREEWLGDLVETRHDLIKEGYPKWVASLITVAKSGLLVWSLIRIRYQDLVSPAERKKQD
jgi:hypothetical protein